MVSAPVLQTGGSGIVTHLVHHDQLEWNKILYDKWFKKKEKRIKRASTIIVCQFCQNKKEIIGTVEGSIPSSTYQ